MGHDSPAEIKIAVAVPPAIGCKNRFEMGRPKESHTLLDNRKIRNSEHADMAVTPGLTCNPLDHLVDVPNGLRVRIHVTKIAIRSLSAAKISNDKTISTAHKKVKITGFNGGSFPGEGHRHDLDGLFSFIIGVNRQNRWKLSATVRPENIRIKGDVLGNG